MSGWVGWPAGPCWWGWRQPALAAPALHLRGPHGSTPAVLACQRGCLQSFCTSRQPPALLPAGRCAAVPQPLHGQPLRRWLRLLPSALPQRGECRPCHRLSLLGDWVQTICEACNVCHTAPASSEAPCSLHIPRALALACLHKRDMLPRCLATKALLPSACLAVAPSVAELQPDLHQQVPPAHQAVPGRPEVCAAGQTGPVACH